MIYLNLIYLIQYQINHYKFRKNRVTIGKKWSTGVQWSFRKTFNDINIDGVNNSPLPPSMNSQLINNDWYSFAGLFITYKIFDFGITCPAYESKF